MAEANIKISIQWQSTSGDCSLCDGCKDVIYGKKYELLLITDGVKQDTNVVLCESCYNTIKEDND